MSNQIGDAGAQSAQDAKEREGELLCLKIKAQLEDLFSDSHLAEDGFLLKHVQRSRQGYVSLKLLTCLKKIKVLTKDWCMTLVGAVCSDVLEVNDECTKVRRIEPLPEWLLCSPTSKLLLVWNITAEKTEEGLEHLSHFERILQKFSAHGNIASFWILHPGKELPKELQCYTKRHKQLGQQLCVVVKFDHLEAVRKAYSALKADEVKSNGQGMCVLPLGFQSKQQVTKDEPSEENNGDRQSEENNGDRQSEENNGDRPGESQENPPENTEDSFQEELSSAAKVSDKTLDTSQLQESLDNSMRKTFVPIHPPFSGLNLRYSRLNWCSGDCYKENSQSPWVLRRKFAAGELHPKVAGHLNVPSLMQRVLRHPFSPDGTKGFLCRGKEESKLLPGWRNTICAQ